MKSSVIYARYSSYKQNEMSIEGQIAECRKYAKDNDINIIGEYIDRAKSATTDHRPNFLRMVDDSANGDFDTILVYQLDRFARNRNDSGYYKKILSDNGVKVISAKEHIPDDITGVLTEGMLEIYADFFSKQHAQKVHRGMYQNAEKCKYNGGTMTFGFSVDKDGYYILDKDRAPIVKEIFERIADGETAASVCEDLNRRGIKTIRGSSFVKNSLQNMLRNEKYRGVYTFGDVRIPDGIPRIVSDELFEDVQDALGHRNSKGRPPEEDYLLTGKLYCGHCNSTMVGNSGTSHTGTVYRYYTCSNCNKGCNKKHVKKSFIEAQVMRICRDSLTEESIETIMKSVQELNASDLERPEIIRLQKAIKETELRIEKLLDQLEQGVQSSRFASRINEREMELQNLKRQLRAEERKQILIEPDIVRHFLHAIRNGEHEKNVSYKKGLIKMLIDKIYLYDDHMRIMMTYTGGPDGATDADEEDAEYYFTEAGSESEDSGVPINPDVSRTSGFLYVSVISRFVNFPTFFPHFVYPMAIFVRVSTAFAFSSNPTFT